MGVIPKEFAWLSITVTSSWRDSVSNHQPHDCLLNLLFRRRSKKTSKPRVTGHLAGKSPRTGDFPAQMASNTENVSIWWRYHVNLNEVAPNTMGNTSRRIRRWMKLQLLFRVVSNAMLNLNVHSSWCQLFSIVVHTPTVPFTNMDWH